MYKETNLTYISKKELKTSHSLSRPFHLTTYCSV